MSQIIISKVQTLLNYYKSGQIPTLAHHEVSPGLPRESRENYLYFTLPVCINFQRSSPAMWQGALKTWQDPTTNYLFFPEKVVKTDLEKVRLDLRKHGLSLQINKHTEILTFICQTLHDFYQNDPRGVLEQGYWDCKKIIEILQKTDREKFKFLRGEKLSNYWLYILWQYTDAKTKLTNIRALSIIPDTHVIQSTFKLGLSNKLDEKPEVIARLWLELLQSSDITGIDVHPVLWNWSRNNFLPEV